MTITEIEDALYAWISGQTVSEVIFSHQNSPRPTTSYVLINFLTGVNLSTSDVNSVLQVDDSIDNTYSNAKQVVLSINTFYSGAYQLAEDIRNSIDKVTVNDQLYSAGLGYVDSTDVQRLPELVDEEWEERAQFDITFNYRSEVTENIETIQKVQITNELDGTTTTIGD